MAAQPPPTGADEHLVRRLALADDGWPVRFINWLRSPDEPGPAAVVAPPGWSASGSARG